MAICICVHFHFTTESKVCDEHYVVNRVLAKFILITKTIDVTCKQTNSMIFGTGRFNAGFSGLSNNPNFEPKQRSSS